jgi:peptidoglycan/LPS O-acetylase OafA/YrhL
MDETTSSAAEQLSAVHTGESAGTAIGGANRTHDALYGAAVGVLVATMLAIVVFVYPTSEPWLIGPSTVIYGVGIGVIGAIYRMRGRGTSRITAQRYRVGFLLTMSFYGIGVLLAVIGLGLPLWFWIGYILATAVPMTIASMPGVPRER